MNPGPLLQQAALEDFEENMTRRMSNTTRKQSSPLDLPVEVFLRVIEELTTPERWAVMNVSRRWRERMMGDVLIWRHFEPLMFKPLHLDTAMFHLKKMAGGGFTSLKYMSTPRVFFAKGHVPRETWVRKRLLPFACENLRSLDLHADTFVIDALHALVRPQLLAELNVQLQLPEIVKLAHEDIHRAIFLCTGLQSLVIDGYKAVWTRYDASGIRTHHYALWEPENWATSLRSLELHSQNPQGSVFSTPTLESLAEAAPNLENLTMIGYNLRQWGDMLWDIISSMDFSIFKKLKAFNGARLKFNRCPKFPKSLEVLRLATRLSSLDDIFPTDEEALTLPNLKVLATTLDGYERADGSSSWVDMIVRSGCKLQELTLEPVAIGSRTTGNRVPRTGWSSRMLLHLLLRDLLPNLEVLQFAGHGKIDDPQLHNNLGYGLKVRCPKLRNLVWMGHCYLNFDIVMALLESDSEEPMNLTFEHIPPNWPREWLSADGEEAEAA